MLKIPTLARLPINFFLDYTLVGMIIVCIVFSLGNFWYLSIAEPRSNQILIEKKIPPRWENLPILRPSSDPQVQRKPIANISTNSNLNTKLVMLSDDKIEQFTKTLIDKQITPPFKISPNIYEIRVSSENESTFNQIINDKQLVSSSDDELFLLEDELLTEKIALQNSQEIPSPDQLNPIVLPTTLPPQEINKAAELRSLASLPRDKYIGSQWHLNDPKLKPNTKSIIVAVIDGGVDISHPDLSDVIAKDSNNQVLGWNYWDNTPVRLADVSSKLDEAYGHGTHIAGTIGASSNNIGVVGSCLGTCKIMPIKIFGGVKSTGSTSNAVKAISYATLNGAKIINLSWGARNFNPILAQAISNAQASGVSIIAAAGNNGEDNILYPAKLEGVISVGSLDKEGNRSKTTNYGAGITRYTPGVDILATSIALSNTCSQDYQGFDNDLYNYCSGTSMATAVTSGLIARELSESL